MHDSMFNNVWAIEQPNESKRHLPNVPTTATPDKISIHHIHSRILDSFVRGNL